MGSSPIPATIGPLVKRLRHRPFTAVTAVRFCYGSPAKQAGTAFAVPACFVVFPYESSCANLLANSPERAANPSMDKHRRTARFSSDSATGHQRKQKTGLLWAALFFVFLDDLYESSCANLPANSPEHAAQIGRVSHRTDLPGEKFIFFAKSIALTANL